MKDRAILVAAVLLASMVGCQRRECEYIKTPKGDEVCREDQSPADQAEQAVSTEEANWREARGTPQED